jgi:HEAT repeat protein
MNLKNFLAAAMAVALLGAATPAVYAFPSAAAYAEPNDERSEREADLYDEGTDAIDDEQWDEAIKHFTRVAEMKGERADGAIFWTAYALNKLGRSAEALKTVDALKKGYPKSRWLDDARALELEARQGRGERVAPASVDDQELKMIAINSLMHTDPEKAYPLLEKIVKGNSSKKIKDRALFILSQSGSSRSQALLADIARGNTNPDMQKQAVRYLGMSGNRGNLEVLASLYSSATSASVKKEVLHAYMLSGQKGPVLTAARGEKDPGLRKEAIRQLGIMGARQELATMYNSETSVDVREEVIQALFIAGDSGTIGNLAKTEKNPQLRLEAIQKLGLMGGGTGPLLLEIYRNDTDQDVKEAVIQAFFLQGNARELIALAKKETNKNLRNDALQKLSLMNNDEALQYMLEILNEN